LIRPLGHLQKKVLWQNHADTHQLPGDRNEPEPARVASGNDADVVRAGAFNWRHSFVMRKDGDVRQPRFICAQVELPGDEAMSSCGVDESADPNAKGIT